MNCSTLHRYPFLRLILPFIAGIVLGDGIYFAWHKDISTIVYMLCGLYILMLIGGFIFRHYITRWIFGTLLFSGLFITGFIITTQYLCNISTAFPPNETIYKIELSSTPQNKERSRMIKAKILEYKDKNKLIPFNANVILYFQKDTLSSHLKNGDVLFVSTRITEPADNGNPDSFDYAKYLHRKGVGGIGFIRTERWVYLTHHINKDIAARALQYREHILSLYRSFHWDKDVFSVVSALTVGYMDELSSDIRETYSIAGASHVLSLSGLHIGFLYALLLFLLRFMGRSKKTSFIRGIIIIITLWGFAFFTGLSPSVVRSVIMFSLFATAEALRRNNFSLNTLCVAAMFMLLIQPEWLFDVSFQLSFCAVASLILFEPYIRNIIKTRTYIGKWLWQITSVSIAAQLGTVPLVLFYFSRFSVHFILTGLVVIPLSSIVMYVTVVLLICTPIKTLQLFVADILQWLVQTLNSFLRWIEHLPYSSIDGIWLYLGEIITIYIILLFVLAYLHSHRIRYIYTSLIGLLILITTHCLYFQKDFPDNSIELYNIRSCPVIHCISADTHSWLVYAQTNKNKKELHKILTPHFNHLHLQKPYEIEQTDTYQNKNIEICNNILTFQGIRIGMINDNRWRYQKADNPLPLNYLYICKGFNGKLEELFGLFQTRKIIIDSSVSEKRRNALVETCKNYHISYILLQSGAYRILL